MIEINNNISICQVIKIIDKKTGEKQFLKINDNDKWIKISENEYNQIRGKDNEQ